MTIPFRAVPLLLAALLSTGCASRQDESSRARPSPAAPLRLRVMTYNIHHGEGADGRIDLERIARVIRGQKPDLVALQEVDVKTQRSGGVDQAAEVGRLAGMEVAFGRAIDYQGGQYGQAILSRFPLHDFKVNVLPGDPAREQRAAVSAWVRAWGENRPPLRFVGTHLHHLSEADRLQQADELNRLFAADAAETPTVLVGDLNAQPASATIGKLLLHWQDAAADAGPGHTFPAGAPNRRIDYVLLRPANRWRVVGTRVVDEPNASDHRPVVADLELVRPRAATARSDN